MVIMANSQDSYPTKNGTDEVFPRHIDPDVYIALDSEGFQVSLNRFSTGGGLIAWHEEDGEVNLLNLLTTDSVFKKAKVQAYQEGSTKKLFNKRKYLRVAPIVQSQGLVRLDTPEVSIVFEKDALTRNVPELSVACDKWESVDRNLIKLNALHISGLLPQLLADAGFDHS